MTHEPRCPICGDPDYSWEHFRTHPWHHRLRWSWNYDPSGMALQIAFTVLIVVLILAALVAVTGEPW